MKRLFLLLIVCMASGIASAQDARNLLEIDGNSFRPVQTEVLKGVNIDKIEVDRSKRPCARIKMHVNRMTREEIEQIEVRLPGGMVELTKRFVAEGGNGLIFEVTAKSDTRIYLHHNEFGDSNEVTVDLEADKEYYLDACLNQLYSITVNANMKEADVYIDDVYKGKTNNEFYLLVHDVLPGDHNLRVECAGRVSTMPITVHKESLFFRCAINNQASLPQYVVFEVKPKSATVVIDGRSYDPEEGFVTAVLQNGSYNYRVQAKDYHSKSGSILVSGAKVERKVHLRQAFGWLNFTNTETINGAKVYVDGEEIGTLPLAKNYPLSSGEHTVRLSKAMYKSFEQKIVVRDSALYKSSPVLQPDFASVTIKSMEGSEIWVNGVRKGLSPWVGALATGTYIFEARKEGYTPSVLTKNITPNPSQQSYEIEAPKAILGMLNISSTPAMAEILIDGKSVGRTPLMINAVIGTHTIKLKKDGYGEYQATVSVNKGETTNFSHKFDSATQIFTDAKSLYSKRDYTNALPKLTSAANQGHAEACTYLGYCYQFGYGVTKDMDTAISWYRKGVERGNDRAQYALGNIYYNGTGLEKNLAEAFKLYMKSAEQGNAAAQNAVGVCYRNGYGVTKNETEALSWYRKSAAQGQVNAIYNLGLCYHYGRGVAIDKEQARVWYQKAADKGYAKAKEQLQKLDSSSGTTSSSSSTTSTTSSSSATTSSSNSSSSMYLSLPDSRVIKATVSSNGMSAEDIYKLAQTYNSGSDRTRAYQYYLKAAEMGYIDAFFDVGLKYRYGLGTSTNFEQAIHWFERYYKERSNISTAVRLIGECYQEGGYGINADRAKAIYWYTIAKKLGCDTSAKALRSLGQNTGSTQSSTLGSSSYSTSSSSKPSTSYTSSSSKSNSYSPSRSKSSRSRSRSSLSGFNVGLSLGTGYAGFTDEYGNYDEIEFNAGVMWRLWNWDTMFNVHTGFTYTYTFDLHMLSLPVVINWNYLRYDSGSIYSGVGAEPSLVLAKYDGERLKGFDCPIVVNVCGFGMRHSDLSCYMKFYIKTKSLWTVGLKYTYLF